MPEECLTITNSTDPDTGINLELPDRGLLANFGEAFLLIFFCVSLYVLYITNYPTDS